MSSDNYFQIEKSKFCDKFKISWQKANIFTYLVLSELIPRVFFLAIVLESPTATKDSRVKHKNDTASREDFVVAGTSK